MTDARPNVVERAYEMARSGSFVTVAEIESQLNREDYLDVSSQLTGRTLRRDLRALCTAARKSADTRAT